MMDDSSGEKCLHQIYVVSMSSDERAKVSLAGMIRTGTPIRRKQADLVVTPTAVYFRKLRSSTKSTPLRR